LRVLRCLPAAQPHTQQQSQHPQGPAPWPSCTAHWLQQRLAGAGSGCPCGHADSSQNRHQHACQAQIYVNFVEQYIITVVTC
jgi:hypothetical protein